ncbi:MAG: hypothetical protein ABF303_08775 [Desulfobacterales bacterium]|jgi:hypothetical protein
MALYNACCFTLRNPGELCVNSQVGGRRHLEVVEGLKGMLQAAEPLAREPEIVSQVA